MDICREKKFIDLKNKVTFHQKQGDIKSIIDSKRNIWIKNKELPSGTTGKVFIFKSQNQENSDLVVKYFYSDDRKDEDAEHEVEMIDILNASRCPNFIKIGHLNFDNQKIVIMEKLDGDLVDFDFTFFSKPLKLFSDLIEFLSSASLCALREEKLYLDLKLENIGFKICMDRIKFTFLDFGSFFDLDEENIISTYNINNKKFSEGYFSNELIFVYGFIMTLLNVRLMIKSSKLTEKFIEYHISDIGNERKYKSVNNLLSKSNYERIKKRFYSYLDTHERFITFLFSQLELLTKEEPDVLQFLREVRSRNHYN